MQVGKDEQMSKQNNHGCCRHVSTEYKGKKKKKRKDEPFISVHSLPDLNGAFVGLVMGQRKPTWVKGKLVALVRVAFLSLALWLLQLGPAASLALPCSRTVGWRSSQRAAAFNPLMGKLRNPLLGVLQAANR